MVEIGRMYDDWPTVSEVAEKLSIDKKQFTAMVREGKYKGVKIGARGRNGYWRVDPQQFPELFQHWLDTETVGQMLGITAHSVANLIRNKKLKGQKFGKSWKVDPADPRISNAQQNGNAPKNADEDRSGWIDIATAARQSGFSKVTLRKRIREKVLRAELAQISKNTKRWFVDPDSLASLPKPREYTHRTVPNVGGFPAMPSSELNNNTTELVITPERLPEELTRVLELVSLGARVDSFTASLSFEWSKDNA